LDVKPSPFGRGKGEGVLARRRFALTPALSRLGRPSGERGKYGGQESRAGDVWFSALAGPFLQETFAMCCGSTACRMSTAGSSTVLRARIIDEVGRPIRSADVQQVDCIVRELDSCRPRIHEFAVERCDVLLPALVRDRSWTVDKVGYNFRHDLTKVAEFVGPRCEGRVEMAYVFTLVKGVQETVSFYLKLG
jgi:hypothetical protein